LDAIFLTEQFGGKFHGTRKQEEIHVQTKTPSIKD
jgi:hypothetical protein